MTFLHRTSLVAAFALATATRLTAQEGGIAVGATAPAASVVRLDGTVTDLSDYYGDKPVVLEFWATWCPLCKKLEPSMQAARERHAGAVKFVGVGVPSNQTAEKQRMYVDKQQLTGDYVFDKDGAAVAAFKVPHTSYIVIIDHNRKVVYTGVGAEQDIEAALKKVGM
jgi:thiol-disulfide isomerase/thioredoxin